MIYKLIRLNTNTRINKKNTKTNMNYKVFPSNQFLKISIWRFICTVNLHYLKLQWPRIFGLVWDNQFEIKGIEM